MIKYTTSWSHEKYAPNNDSTPMTTDMSTTTQRKVKISQRDLSPKEKQEERKTKEKKEKTKETHSSVLHINPGISLAGLRYLYQH